MNQTIDRWLQRISVAAMVGLAVTLLGVGLALYAPAPAHRGPPAAAQPR